VLLLRQLVGTGLAVIVVVGLAIAVFITFDSVASEVGRRPVSCGSPADPRKGPDVPEPVHERSCEQLLDHARSTRLAALLWAAGALVLLGVLQLATLLHARAHGGDVTPELLSPSLGPVEFVRCSTAFNDGTFYASWPLCRLLADREGLHVRGLTTRDVPWSEVVRLARCGPFLQWGVRVVLADGSRFLLGGFSILATVNHFAAPDLWVREPRRMLFGWDGRAEPPIEPRSAAVAGEGED
jgi:hypothetical protein